MPTVELQKLNKVYDGSVTAVDNLNLTVGDGELLVLMGPSGCGKSTTLRMTAGLEQPDSGKIIVQGNDITKLHPGKRNIGMVFQNFALYPHKSIFENLAFGLRIRKTPVAEITRQINEVCDRLDITSLLKRFPDQISGGQKQRVALGRALLRGSDLLLFDEPLSNLDAKLRQQLRIEIASLHCEKKFTGIFVTHDQTEAMTLADRIAVMNKGMLIQTGTPQEIYDHPADIFVAQFSGSPPMNIFEGSVNKSLFSNELFSFEVPEGTQKVGIRPDDITHGNGEISFKANVIQPELNGREWIIHAAQENVRFSCKSGISLQPGSVESFSINHKNIHFFDHSGNRIKSNVSV